MSDPKEPDFFDTDRRQNFTTDEAGYARYFRACHDGHDVIAEASTSYLRSDVAIEAIERFSPGSKFVVGLRNPVDMAFSWHGQAVFESWETELDFERAWRLQELRRRGEQVPPGCTEPRDLLYADVCMLGRQVERLVAAVGRDRVCVYTIDELADPANVYRRVVAFAGLEDDGRREFPVHNVAKEVPRWLSRSHRWVSDWKRRAGLADRGFGVITALTSRLARDRSTTMSAELRAELTDFFRDDVAMLSRVTGLDLSAWVDGGVSGG